MMTYFYDDYEDFEPVTFKVAFSSDTAKRFMNELLKEHRFAFPTRQGYVSIKRVIYNPPATIVYWSDSSRTVVKANNEKFDKEKGLAMAIIKKVCGNNGNFNEIFKEYCND